MRGKILLTVTMLFLLLSICNVSATEFDNSDPDNQMIFEETLLSDPIDPKIACHPAGFHCLALIYEDNTYFGRGIKVKYTTDYFQGLFGTREVGSISKDFSSLVSGYFDTYHLPYDVTYTNGKYYFFVEDTIYSYPENGDTFESTGTFDASFVDRWGLGFIDEDTVRTFEPIKTNDAQGYSFTKMKGTVLGEHYIVKANWSGDTNLITLREFSNNIINGSTEQSGGAIGDPSQYGKSHADLPSFPTDYSGLGFWDGSYIYYERNDNSSWKVSTTDVSSYGSPQHLWDWNIPANMINNSDGDITDTNRITIYKRDGTYTPYDGIWIYTLDLTTLRVWGMGYDVNKKTTTIPDITIDLSCEDYETSESGSYVNIQTPCQYGNNITINTFEHQPNTVVLPNFSISDQCLGVTNYIRSTEGKGFYKTMDFTVNVRDEFLGNPVSNVTVSLDTDEEITDQTGKAVFEDIFPINNPEMELEDYSDFPECTQYYTFTGGEKTYSVILNSDGYEEKEENLKIATSPFDVETDFITSKTFYITPENTRIEVFVYSQDGIELKPTKLTVNVTEGSNDTYWVYGNQWFHQSYANSVPALFYLLNNTGTFNVTVELDYFDTYEETVEVSVGDYEKVEFYLDYNSWELPCNYDADCQQDMCTGKFLKRLKGCKSNVCTYETIDCGTEDKCDVGLGCVDVASLTSCSKDQDCENYCLDNYTMVDYKCGEDELCKGIYVDCKQNCNQSLGYCKELEKCITGQTQDFRVGYYLDDGFFHGTQWEAVCDFSNAGKHICEKGATITESELDQWGKSWEDVIVEPNGWVAEFNSDGSELDFYDVSIYCNDQCNISWEFCENGCDVESGLCKGILKITDDIYGLGSMGSDWIGDFVGFYNMIFFDIHIRSFMWFFWGLLIYIGVWFFKANALPSSIKNVSVGSNHEGDVILLLVWFAIGSVFGQFYWFVWFAITILAVYFVANYFVKRHGGND